MNEQELQEVTRNKAIRGYILRSLAKGFHNCLLVRQVSSALIQDGLSISPDIGKHIDYLVDAGYIEITNKRVNAYAAYKDDAVIRLTKSGVDLLECTIEDPGVDV